MTTSINRPYLNSGLSVALRHLSTLLLCILPVTLLAGCASGSKPFSTTEAPAAPIVVTSSQNQLRIGQTTTFGATQSGATVSGGSWSVVGGSANGTITPAGLYQTPSAVPAADVVTVDFTVDGTAYPSTLTLMNPVPVLSATSPSTLTASTTQVAISGAGFVPGTTVTIGGVAATTSYINSGQLSATVNLAAPPASGSVQLIATNPNPGSATSSPLLIPVNLPAISVNPSVLQGGSVTLTITGASFTGSPVVTMDGKELATKVSSPTSLVATGYLVPWKSGTSTIGVAPASGSAPTVQIAVPIAPTAVSYDTASRFATQAAFGPRHDIIEHIQQIGLDAFITEQMQQPGLPYSITAPCCGPRLTFLQNATSGNSLLRARVSWALQTFIVTQATDKLPTLIPWQQTMEKDAFGNFLQVLTDVAADPSMGLFLNLAGNNASTDPTVHPNQNFARELMQLFSLGDVMLNDDGSVQVDSTGTPIATYDQTTILNLSRVFTGWNCQDIPDPNINPYDCNYGYPLAATGIHDEGQKVLFGSVVIPAGQDAATDRSMALQAVFNHPNVPPYISHILIQRLVKSNPSPAYIARISSVFKNDGNGVRGNLAAVVRAILLDPEARAGDATPAGNDGFLQEPLLFQTFGMSLLGITQTDGEPTYVPGDLGEDYDYAQTVFGYYTPTYKIPGTSIVSPEFTILNNLSVIQRSQYWWGMIQGSIDGFQRLPNYLYSTFTNVPDMVDALNHLLYHGMMPANEQAAIIAYCNTLDPTNVQAQLDAAVFLAGNGDSYNVSQ